MGNRTLGKFHLEGIMPAPRGVPKIEVTFDIDANGIINVHAKDTATSKEIKHRIEGGGGLSEADVQRMVKEASEHEAEDKERREQIERRNKLDNLCYTLEKSISENKEKMQAAWNGRAWTVSWMPSSSRRWAPSGSASVSCTATSRARSGVRPRRM